MKNKVDVVWKEGMAFESTFGEQKITMDAVEAVGGKNSGPRPKQVTLVSLGGCTGMDVVSILKKMRVEIDSFHMEIEGDISEEHPKIFKTITISYIFRGKGLPMDKLEKAVNLSQDRYCAVTAMLKEAVNISHKVIVEE